MFRFPLFETKKEWYNDHRAAAGRCFLPRIGRKMEFFFPGDADCRHAPAGKLSKRFPSAAPVLIGT